MRDSIVMVTDIVQSTSLARMVGDEWPALLARHDEIVDRACSSFDGRRSGFTGDGFSYVFADPAAALGAAVRTVRDVDAEPWPGEAGVRLRIGLHAGPVHEVAGEFSGVTIHEAARVAALAGTGRVLISEAVRIALTALPQELRIVDLGPHEVRDLPGPTRLYSVEPVDAIDAELGEALESPSATPLLGRGEVLESLRSELEQTRVLSLVGPGGIGKTRLATELHRTHAGDAVLVDLTRLDAGRGLEPTLVDALVARGAAPQDSAAEAIGSRSILLVLDNCEHVASEARSLCEELIVVCPRLRVVTTSRRVLGIDGERVWFAPTLPETAARELFYSRAAGAIGTARAQALDPLGVAEVCRRVDCMPLAIELVAARLRAFGLIDLLAHMDDQPRLLVDRSRPAEDRRHGIATAIEQTVETLDESCRDVFASMSVFRGGADLDGLCAVMPDHDSLDLLDALEELVDTSLVQRSDGPSGRSRYGQLEPVRQYADHALLDVDRRRLQDQHASWVARTVGPAGLEVLVRLSARQLLNAESPNIEQALAHLVASDQLPEALRVVGHLGYYWFSESPALGWDLSNRVLDAATGEEPPRIRANALIAAGQLALQTKRLGDARNMFAAALELLGDEPSRQRGWAQYHLGRAQAFDEGLDTAIPTFEAATADFLEVDDHLGRAWSLFWRANLNADLDAARPMEEELLALARTEGIDHVLPAVLQNFEAFHAFRSGRPGDAYQHLEEAVSILERLGDLWQLADIRIASASLTLTFQQPQYWHYLRLAAEGMGHEAAMAHADHFLIVAAEGLRRHGQLALACELAWSIDEHTMVRETPRRSDFDGWVYGCRAFGPRPAQALDREDAVALAVTAILASDE
ncbi:MAG: ATP-binding protein [Acidimicrobiales bacterium]